MLLLVGCVSKTRWEMSAMQENLLKIQPGMSKEQVVSILGIPSSREVIPDKDGQPIEFLFYQTRFAGDALFVPKDSDLTPFMFVQDKLIGWSRNYYDKTIRQEITVKQIIQGEIEVNTSTAEEKAPTQKTTPASKDDAHF
jgi:hypothetical protein